MVLTGSLAVVGSANLSHNSAEYLTETAILSKDTILLSQTKSFLHNLEEESEKLSTEELERLANLPVLPGQHLRVKPAKVRELEFGNRYWFLNTRSLSEEIQQREASSVEKAQQEIFNVHGLEDERVGYIRLVGNGYFQRNVK